MTYKHILLVTDLAKDADHVAKKAKNILDLQNDAKLSVLHIVQDTMVNFGYELVPMTGLYEEVDAERCQVAKEQMAEFLARNKLTADNAEITTAISSTDGIIHYCNNHQVDLIIIGRHERHGWSALIKGATVDNIMPDVSCDVLVIHLDEPKD